MAKQQFAFVRRYFLLIRRNGTMSTANAKKFVPVSAAWRNAESFTDYLLNKVQTKKD